MQHVPVFLRAHKILKNISHYFIITMMFRGVEGHLCLGCCKGARMADLKTAESNWVIRTQ